MTSKTLIALSLGLLLVPTISRANTTDGLLIGGFAGLTAGLITSAAAHHSHHRCHRHYYEQPVCIEQERVYVDRPVIVERVVERPLPIRRRVRPMPCPQPVEIIEVVEPAPMRVEQAPKKNHLKDRELALKEEQLRLEILKAENKKRELDLKERELALKAQEKISVKAN